MSVLLLTVFIGVVLVLFFVVMFLRQVVDPRGTSERDALLPLAAEKPCMPESRRQSTHSPRGKIYEQPHSNQNRRRV